MLFPFWLLPSNFIVIIVPDIDVMKGVGEPLLISCCRCVDSVQDTLIRSPPRSFETTHSFSVAHAHQSSPTGSPDTVFKDLGVDFRVVLAVPVNF